ncbi:MAG TPA: phosphatase PAP2 family protein [Chloroflexia bacterium]|nr:phosphatase PAP2 family protein [Chloroflexia bacterium]
MPEPVDPTPPVAPQDASPPTDAVPKPVAAVVSAAISAEQAVAPVTQAAVQATQQVAQQAAQVTQQAVQQVAQQAAQATQQAAQVTQQAAQVTQHAAQQVQAKMEQVGQTTTVSPRQALYRGRRFAVAYAITVMVAAFLSALAKRYRTLPGDIRLARLVQRGQHDKAYDVMMQAVSELGWQWPSVISRMTFSSLMWAAGFRMEGAFTAATWSGDLVTIVVKQTVGRPRPTKDLVRVVHNLGETSFPSGHVVHYVTFYGFLFYIFFTHLKQGQWRNAGLCVLAALVLLVGPSRVYMGEHWPSDVGGAYLVGSLWLAVEIVAYLEMKARFQMNRRWPFLTPRSSPIP